jgi:hypothetical protein
MQIIDAGRADAAGSCDTCEPPITAERVYQVQNTESAGTVLVGSVARCQTGDVLVSGGCFVHRTGANTFADNRDGATPLLDFGPRPTVGSEMGDATEYDCVYENQEMFTDMTVVATAICLDITP